MSLWFFNVYVYSVMKEVKIRMGRMRVRFLEERGDWRLFSLLCANDFVFYGELEVDLKMRMG